MSRTTASPKIRRTLGVAGVVVILGAVAIVGTLGHRSLSSPDVLFDEIFHGGDGATTDGDGAVTRDDGAVPDGVTVFDDEYPAVANLDPDLLRALREAARDASEDGIEFYVNSGWRAPAYQNQLLREAISKYGSEEEAARWVATAATSAHVLGDAVDIGHAEATAWLSEHGAEYGLCQIYRNEPWHYELRRSAIEDQCPRMYADPTQDPSIRR